jgi:hypothetical protein
MIYLRFFLSIHHNNRKIAIGNLPKTKLRDNRIVTKRDPLGLVAAPQERYPVPLGIGRVETKNSHVLNEFP